MRMRYVAMTTVVGVREAAESPGSGHDGAHRGGSEGADSTTVASASSISRLTPSDSSGVFPCPPSLSEHDSELVWMKSRSRIASAVLHRPVVSPVQRVG